MSRVRIRNWVKFRVERLLLRGAHFRLLFTAALVGVVSSLAGLAVGYFDASLANPGDAIWWAFLRLTDPGYLGDDVGVGPRVISTTLTVLGLALFVGSLVAIMTQWLSQTLRNLERGFTPVAVSGHILVLGWTNRTVAVLHELLHSDDRVRRFMRRFGKRRLVIVALVDDVNAELVQRLKDGLRGSWDPGALILRSGSALQVEHLERAAFSKAAAVIIPAADFSYGGPESADTRFIKTILTIGHDGFRKGRSLPLLVGEIFDQRKLDIARRAYGGPIEILGSHVLIARLITQSVRFPGVSRVFAELLTLDEGNEVYIRSGAEFAGKTVGEIRDCFPQAILLGLVTPSGDSYSPHLNPSPDTRIDSNLGLVLLARSYDETQPRGKVAVDGMVPGVGIDSPKRGARRILLLGWSHKAPTLLAELVSYSEEPCEILSLSTTSANVRRSELVQQGIEASQISLQTLDGDYTVPAHLAQVEPSSFDAIVMLASDRVDSSEEADARCAAGLLVLEDALRVSERPQVIVEVLIADNARLAPASVETVVSPILLSHMLAQISLRRELRAVFDELFDSEGPEIRLLPYRQLAENPPSSFADLTAICRANSDTALGVQYRNGRIDLNPSINRRWHPEEITDIIVLATQSTRRSLATQSTPRS